MSALRRAALVWMPRILILGALAGCVVSPHRNSRWTAYQEEAPLPAESIAAEEADAWDVAFAPYAWLLNLEGDILLREREASVDVDPSDILKQVNIVLEARVEATKGDWGFLFDPTYALLEDEVGAGSAKIDVQTEMALAHGQGLDQDVVRRDQRCVTLEHLLPGLARSPMALVGLVEHRQKGRSVDEDLPHRSASRSS